MTDPATASFRERRVVHAGEHRDRDDEGGLRARAGRGISRGVARGLHHVCAARCVDVDHPHAERRGRGNRLRNGVGNVVELEIEEDAVSLVDEGADDEGPSDVNRRLPILKPPAMPRR